MSNLALTSAMVLAALSEIAKEVVKAASGEAGKAVWRQLTGPAKHLWERIHKLAEKDEGAKKAISKFRASPANNTNQNDLAKHIERLSQQEPKEAKELAALCIQVVGKVSGDMMVIHGEKVVVVDKPKGETKISM